MSLRKQKCISSESRTPACMVKASFCSLSCIFKRGIDNCNNTDVVQQPCRYCSQYLLNSIFEMQLCCTCHSHAWTLTITHFYHSSLQQECTGASPVDATRNISCVGLAYMAYRSSQALAGCALAFEQSTGFAAMENLGSMLDETAFCTLYAAHISAIETF